MLHRGGQSRDTETEKLETRPDKYPRPGIIDPGTDTEWEFFKSSWESYKRATGLKGQ